MFLKILVFLDIPLFIVIVPDVSKDRSALMSISPRMCMASAYDNKISTQLWTMSACNCDVRYDWWRNKR